MSDPNLISDQVLSPETVIVPEAESAPEAPKHVKKKKKHTGLPGRILRRTLLLLLTALIMAAVSGGLLLNTIFNGPSETARNVAVLQLSESPATRWIPGLYLDEALVEQILREHVAGKEG